MRRAIKDLAGDHRKVIQVDIQNGPKWDMVNGELFEELLYMTITGQVGAVIGGPNCRTRSVLRHQPREGMPGPARSWENGQQWGNCDNSLEERQKCFEDDLMMMRLIMLFVVAEEIRKTGGNINPQDRIGLLIEHPAPPEDKPEVVSWWRTTQWSELKRAYDLDLYVLNQGDLGGAAHKPTALGTNMELSFPEHKVHGYRGPRRVEGMTPEEIARQSRQLARWTPVLMSGIAEACMRAVGQAVKRRLCSWRTHLAREHVPFRKDCQICQEAMGRDRPHHRQKLPPRVGVLSLDTAGPLERSPDLNLAPGSRGCTAKYIMVGTFTWLSGKKEGDDLEEPVADVPEGAAELPAGEEEDQDPGELHGDVEAPAEGEQGGHGDPEHPMPQVEVFRIAVPMETKSQDVVLKTVSQIYLTLRTDGFVVNQLHTDRGGEFLGQSLHRRVRLTIDLTTRQCSSMSRPTADAITSR